MHCNPLIPIHDVQLPTKTCQLVFHQPAHASERCFQGSAGFRARRTFIHCVMVIDVNMRRYARRILSWAGGSYVGQDCSMNDLICTIRRKCANELEAQSTCLGKQTAYIIWMLCTYRKDDTNCGAKVVRACRVCQQQIRSPKSMDQRYQKVEYSATSFMTGIDEG